MLVLLAAVMMGAVAQTDVSTFAQLQSALNAGNDVRLTGNISFSSAITISGGKKVTINGNGKTLSGPSTRAFSVNSGSTLAIKNATLNNFDLNSGGGAIRNNGTLVLDGCIVSNNHTDGSNQGGGAIENQGKLYASNTTFSGNYSSEIGGAINNYQGSLYLSGCTFINNYTTSTNARYGGAIGNNSSGTLVLVNCTFSGNKYGGSGGSASDLGVYRTTSDYTIAGCAGITITGATMTTYPEGSADLDFSDLDNIKFVPSTVAKYDITLSEESTAHGTVTFSVGGVAATQAKKGDVVTITVVPGEGYSTKKVTVRAYTSWGSANARGFRAPVLQDEITVNAGQTADTWTFTMPEANVWVVVTYARELQDSWIQPIANQYYTGSAIEPVVTVKDGSTTLTPGTDYTVSYDNNVEVGTANVTITAVNGSDYSGTASSTFVIERAENKLLKELYDALGSDVWTGYGERTGVISYSRGDDPQEFRAMFMGGTFTIDLPFTDFTTVTKADNGDESYTYTLVVNLPAQTGMSQETLHVTTKNGEITSMESENAGLEMSKENSGIDSWTALQNAMSNGGVIKLTQTIIASVTDAALTVPEGKTVVLELNGQTVNRALTSAAVDGSVIINNGVLAITDTNGGKIIGGNTTGNGGGILNNGTLTLYGGEITGNKASLNGGGVYNTVTNTSTTGFWMTGGLIDNNTAVSYPAIGGDVTFNNLVVVQVNADGTTLSAKTAKANMAGYSYIKPVMPDPAKYAILTELYNALGDDVWTGYGTQTGVISYSRGDDPNVFRATFMGGTYVIDVPFGDVVSVSKQDHGDGSYIYELTVSLPALTGLPYETLRVTMKNGEITEMESENAGLEMSKESGAIDSWTALQNAINAGGVIKLTQTITASDTDAALTVPEGKTVVIELNGQTINRALTSAAVDGSVIINNGVLAITDTNGGKIIGGNTTGNGGGILNNGTLTLYGGEITGNKASLNGGGVYNTVTNTSTTGFWMTGGLIDNNTAGSHPAIGGDVTFNNLALIQINADGTKVSVSEAIAGMSGYSYVKPVMPDPESYYVVTAPAPKTGLYYTGAEQELVDAGSTTFGVMEYSLDGMTYATAIPTGTEAGKYTVYYRVMGDATHNDYAPQTVTVNIALASLTIHAGEYASYYCGKGLSLAEGTPDGIVLSTVIAVNGTDGSVTLASDLQSAAANTPLIIYNGTDEDQQVLLDVNEQAATVNYDTEHFFGTLEPKDFTATDIAASDHYVLDGVNFTWVKDAGTIAANKCWIELVPASEAHARTLSIVFEGGTDPTGIDSVKTTAENGIWYDLNGRSINGKPSRAGIYIINGKKVVIK